MRYLDITKIPLIAMISDRFLHPAHSPQQNHSAPLIVTPVNFRCDTDGSASNPRNNQFKSRRMHFSRGSASPSLVAGQLIPTNHPFYFRMFATLVTWFRGTKETEVARSRVAQLEHALRGAQNVQEELQLTVRALRSDKANLEARAQQLRDETFAAKNESVLAKVELDGCQKKEMELRATIGALEGELGLCKESAFTEKSFLEADLAKSNMDKKWLKNKIAELQTENESLKAKNKTLKSESKELRIQYSGTTSRNPH